MEDAKKIIDGILSFEHDNIEFFSKQIMKPMVKQEIPDILIPSVNYLTNNKKEWFNPEDYISIYHDDSLISASLLNKSINKNNAKYYYGKSVSLSLTGECLVESKPLPNNLIFPIYEITQEEIIKSVEKISNSITSAKESIDCIVVIPRSGLIPGAYLAYDLGIERVYSSCFYVYSKHKDKTVFDPFQNNESLIEGKTVLLVDSVVDSGHSLIKNLEGLLKYNPKKILTCATHYLASSKILPDFFAFRLPEWRWVATPWDVNLLKTQLLGEKNNNFSDAQKNYLKMSYIFETRD